MISRKNKLDVDYLKSNCGAAWSAIHVFEKLDSTSSWLKTQNQNPVVCLAETQTRGRGRNGNLWLSPNAENIYLSFNWRFESLPPHLPLLSLWIGITVAETIESMGVKGHGIKWPNDLYWQQKKLGGILIETSNASSEVIVGIGINANVSVMEGVDQPWTSLSAVKGKSIDRNKLLVKMLNALFRGMESFSTLNIDSLVSQWVMWDLIRDKPVSFLCGGEVCEGVAQGIDPSGYLLVKLESGEVEAFNTSISKVRW